MEHIINELLKETKYELFHYPETTKKQDIKYIIKRLLKPQNTPKRDYFFWTHAMLAQALETAEDVDTLKKYYDAWITKGLPIYNLDNIMNGYSLLYVYGKTGEEKYKQAANKLYAWVCKYVEQMGNPMSYRKHHPTHVYVDGLGMIVPFLCRYGATFQKQEAIDLGATEITAFLKYGMDEITGLPYHGYDTKTGIKLGIIGWGRAVGWLMLAIADCFQYVQKEEQKNMKSGFEKLVKATMQYLREDGYFSWQLSAMQGPKDTSATAMIAYALKKMISIDGTIGEIRVNQNSEEINLKEILQKINDALLTSCKRGKIYDCSGECEGFSQYPQVYGAYPWSLGPGLRFFLL